MLENYTEQGKGNPAVGGGCNFKQGGQCRPHLEGK